MSLLLSFYGDDFTGSTDAMEALALAGVPTVLFLGLPTAEWQRRFPGVRAMGIAGSSRAMTPEEMGAHLPPVFEQLRGWGAPIVHYKVCSTFDSSPEVGSIGRALELGREAFGRHPVPIVVGAPVLGRYCVFGNLFARSGLDSEPFRLDRHPTMSRHPVTPMRESDLRYHLAEQFSERVNPTEAVALFDVLRLAEPEPAQDRHWAALWERRPRALLLDTLYPEHLLAVGRLLFQEAERSGPLLVVGSSGVEYALTTYWRASGTLPESLSRPVAEPVDRIVVLSGSCSPVTDRQVGTALTEGFEEIPLETPLLVDPATEGKTLQAAATAAVSFLRKGRSVVLHTARGPNDLRIEQTRDRLAAHGLPPHRAAELLGRALGRLARAILEAEPVRRWVVTGGDTSYYTAQELGLRALTMLAPIAPGSPICRAYADDSSVDGLEILFKGGQVGWAELLGDIRAGRPRFRHG
ncbi:MAG: hypothetical protein KatS3mg115_1731 [Candidatus Poribacteria bacterium]|nr:MAG: hypothetical protein KatS3mg115_1731 [Candidatus Poribacteria bacterium]